MLKKIIAAAALASLASTSFAAEPAAPSTPSTPESALLSGFYGGVEIGGSDVWHWEPYRFSYGGFAGYKLNENFAVEAGLRRLGSRDSSFSKRRFDQASISVIGSVKVADKLSLYGRLGVNRLTEKEDYREYPDVKRKDNSLLYGIGASYQLDKNWAARLEVQKPRHDITNLAVGVSYGF